MSTSGATVADLDERIADAFRDGAKSREVPRLIEGSRLPRPWRARSRRRPTPQPPSINRGTSRDFAPSRKASAMRSSRSATVSA